MILSGLRVVEIGGTVTAAAAGAMALKLGATVLRIGTEQKDRRPATQRDRLIDLLNRGKPVLSVPHPLHDAAVERAARADLTIADLSPADPRSVDAYTDLVRRRNTGAWVTVRPFGLHGPRRAHRGGELAGLASGGIMHHMRSGDGRPMKPAGFTASINAGHVAVLAGLHGLLLRRESGRAVHLDLSLQDSVVVTGTFLECAHRLFDCPGRSGVSRHAPPSGLVTCGRGAVWVVSIEDHHWRGFVLAMGDPAWADRIRTTAERHEHADKIREQVDAWASELDAAECARRLQRAGVPATPINAPRDLVEREGEDVRAGYFQQGLPGVPFVLSGTTTNDGIDLDGRPRRPTRVLDVTHVLAGPLGAAWLGAMGLDVLKVEDPARPDFYRRIGPFLRGEPGLERCAYFAAANFSKRSLAVPLGDGGARLRELAGSADLVVENLGRHRAGALGLTPAGLGTGGAVLVSSAGFGATTANAGYRAYGMNVHASGGVIHLSRDRQGQPRNLGTSWGDPITTVWMAALMAAQSLLPPGRRRHADVSMVESVAHLFPEYFARLDAVADESRLDHAAPHGVYRCAGEDRWLAVEIESDAEWACLRRALGEPPELPPDRALDLDRLDAAMDAALRDRDRDRTAEALQAAGVAATPVLSAADLVADRHLWERGLFQEVSHPDWDRARALTGLPWRIAGEGPVALARPPRLGEHAGWASA